MKLHLKRVEQVACPWCGHPEDRSRKECSRCKRPVNMSSLIIRKEADGQWVPLEGIDLSSLAPKLRPTRVPINKRRLGLVALTVTLPGIALGYWCWRQRERARQLESAEIALYRNNPVGTIVARVAAHYDRDAAGELRVLGKATLPDGSVLDVRISAGGVLVAVDYPVVVKDQRFQSRALLERGKPFDAGTFQAHIQSTFDSSWQPPSVLAVAGPLGERLKGPLISRGVGRSAAKLDFSEVFILDQ